MTSQLTTSFWGDEHLKFRHQRIEEDLELRPEWKPYAYVWSYTEEQGEQVIMNTGEAWPGTSACPFSYLWEG